MLLIVSFARVEIKNTDVARPAQTVLAIVGPTAIGLQVAVELVIDSHIKVVEENLRVFVVLQVRIGTAGTGRAVAADDIR